jgi:hypothetical protein
MLLDASAASHIYIAATREVPACYDEKHLRFDALMPMSPLPAATPPLLQLLRCCRRLSRAPPARDDSRRRH